MIKPWVMEVMTTATKSLGAAFSIGNINQLADFTNKRKIWVITIPEEKTNARRISRISVDISTLYTCAKKRMTRQTKPHPLSCKIQYNRLRLRIKGKTTYLHSC